jgi:D-glycero-alpha-D-manno-heptose 1-phosphate guanylyltransferase
MEAIILAGGLGTRLREAVADVPKPMAPINKQPFLEYLLDYWIGQGVTRFILSVGYKWDIIQHYFGAEYHNAALEYSVEEKPLGTGGGIMLALDRLSERQPCLILNGDTFFEVSLSNFLEVHNQSKAEISLALNQATGEKRYDWVILGENDSIKTIEPRSEKLKNGLINGGVYLFSPEVFKSNDWDGISKLSLENDIIPKAIHEKKRLQGFVSSGKFIDIGIPEDYQLATSFFEV